MALEWLAVLKTPAAWILKKILTTAGEGYDRHKASNRAMRGEDLASQTSLHNLICEELKKLADSGKSFSGLQPHSSAGFLRVELLHVILLRI